MSNNNLALRVATAPFLLQTELQATTTRQSELLHVYAPASETLRVTRILNRQRIPHTVNCCHLDSLADKRLVFFRRNQLSSRQQAFLQQAEHAGARVEPLLHYLDQKLQFVEIDLLDTDYLNGITLASNPAHHWQKRLLDVVLSSILLLISLPLWLLTALAIRLESDGPVFFRQRRTGWMDREFDIIKFRSMRQDAEKYGARWASRDDERITRVGRFIRKTRIDELPQLLNVLKGEMSLIGPRPEREFFIRDLEKQVPFYRFRHCVKPGITGLAQVRYTYGASVEDAMHKHRHDLYYIRYQNLWLDLKILFQTLVIVILGKGI